MFLLKRKIITFWKNTPDCQIAGDSSRVQKTIFWRPGVFINYTWTATEELLIKLKYNLYNELRTASKKCCKREINPECFRQSKTLTLWVLELLAWQVKSSGVRQSKILKLPLFADLVVKGLQALDVITVSTPPGSTGN